MSGFTFIERILVCSGYPLLKFCRNLKIVKPKDLINPEKKCIIKTVKIYDFRLNGAQAKAIARKPGR